MPWILSSALIRSSTLSQYSTNPEHQADASRTSCIVRVEITTLVRERAHRHDQRMICIAGAERVVPDLQSALDAAMDVAEQDGLVDGQYTRCWYGDTLDGTGSPFDGDYLAVMVDEYLVQAAVVLRADARLMSFMTSPSSRWRWNW